MLFLDKLERRYYALGTKPKGVGLGISNGVGSGVTKGARNNVLPLSGSNLDRTYGVGASRRSEDQQKQVVGIGESGSNIKKIDEGVEKKDIQTISGGRVQNVQQIDENTAGFVQNVDDSAEIEEFADVSKGPELIGDREADIEAKLGDVIKIGESSITQAKSNPSSNVLPTKRLDPFDLEDFAKDLVIIRDRAEVGFRFEGNKLYSGENNLKFKINNFDKWRPYFLDRLGRVRREPLFWFFWDDGRNFCKGADANINENAIINFDIQFPAPRVRGSKIFLKIQPQKIIRRKQKVGAPETWIVTDRIELYRKKEVKPNGEITYVFADEFTQEETQKKRESAKKSIKNVIPDVVFDEEESMVKVSTLVMETPKIADPKGVGEGSGAKSESIGGGDDSVGIGEGHEDKISSKDVQEFLDTLHTTSDHPSAQAIGKVGSVASTALAYGVGVGAVASVGPIVDVGGIAQGAQRTGEAVDGVLVNLGENRNNAQRLFALKKLLLMVVCRICRLRVSI
jgi:hypothetical protein